MSDAVIQTADETGRTTIVSDDVVCLTTVHDWHPPLFDETGLTLQETNGTCDIADGTATIVYGGSGAGQAGFRNTTAFNVDFVAVWEIQAVFKQAGNRVANKVVSLFAADSISMVADELLSANFGSPSDPATDYDYFHEYVRVGGAPTLIKEGQWAASTEYTIRAVSDGTTLSFYLNGVLQQETPINYWTGHKMNYIAPLLTQTSGTSGDVILEDLWFDHADL